MADEYNDDDWIYKSYYFMLAVDMHRYDEYSLYDRTIDLISVSMGCGN